MDYRCDRQMCIRDSYWIIIREASTIVDLAEKCHVSKSAILRFAKKLGYSGYSEFKYDFSLVGHSSVPEDCLLYTSRCV